MDQLKKQWEKNHGAADQQHTVIVCVVHGGVAEARGCLSTVLVGLLLQNHS